MDGLGERLAFALKSRKTKLLALALEIGVDESALSRWKKTGKMSLENAAGLCLALDISLDWLVLGRAHMDAHRTAPATILGRLQKKDARVLALVLQELHSEVVRQAELQP